MLGTLHLSRTAAAARWSGAGRQYAPMPIVHDAEYQAMRLRAADVDPALYGDYCEPGIFGLECFTAMVEAGHDIDGYVFVGQTCRMLRPIRLGEAVVMSGHVREARAVRGGVSVVDVFRLTDTSGAVCWESELTGYLVDDKAKAAAGDSEARIVKRGPVPVTDWKLLQEKTLTPQKVRDFSEDIGNIIHFDVEFAQKHGFRAPLAQGVMSATWLISTLANDSMPTAFDVDIRFMRPVFWDVPASLYHAQDSKGRLIAAQSLDENGKPSADMQVNWFERSSP